MRIKVLISLAARESRVGLNGYYSCYIRTPYDTPATMITDFFAVKPALAGGYQLIHIRSGRMITIGRTIKGLTRLALELQSYFPGLNLRDGSLDAVFGPDRTPLYDQFWNHIHLFRASDRRR